MAAADPSPTGVLFPTGPEQSSVAEVLNRVNTRGAPWYFCHGPQGRVTFATHEAGKSEHLLGELPFHNRTEGVQANGVLPVLVC